jgi:hypothetical protein
MLEPGNIPLGNKLTSVLI